MTFELKVMVSSNNKVLQSSNRQKRWQVNLRDIMVQTTLIQSKNITTELKMVFIFFDLWKIIAIALKILVYKATDKEYLFSTNQNFRDAELFIHQLKREKKKNESSYRDILIMEWN